jgi:hypothetical protein
MLEEEEEDFRGSFFNTAGGAVANIFGLAETGWNAAPSVYADMMNPQAKTEQRKQSLMNERFKVGLSQQLICSHSNGVSHSEAVTRSKQERKREGQICKLLLIGRPQAQPFFVASFLPLDQSDLPIRE